MLFVIDDSHSLQKTALRLSGLSGLLLLATVVVGKLSLTGPVKSVDVRLFEAIVPWLQSVPGLTATSLAATQVGAIPISYAMITIGGLLVAFQRRRFGVAGLMAASLLGAHLLQRIVVRLVDGTLPEGPDVIGSAGPYFSGGIQRVIIVFGVIASVVAPRLGWSTRTIYGIAIAAGALEGLTRLVLGRHWPFDLAAAFPIGIAILMIFRQALRALELSSESSLPPPAHNPLAPHRPTNQETP